MLDLNLEALLADLRTQQGDTAAVEVKSARGGLPATTGESLCALANYPGGGLLLLGLDERAGFAPVGISDLQALKQGIASKARACAPPVVINISQHAVSGHAVLAAQVAECDRSAKPCRFKGKGWIRAWDGDYSMSLEEEQAFLRLRDAPRFDRVAVDGTSRDDLDAQLTRSWLDTARTLDPLGLGRFSDDDECLKRAGVLTPQGVTSKAGLLALGIQPQQHFPRYVVNLAAEGVSDARAVEATTVSGPIPYMLEGSLDWAKRVMSRRVVQRPDGGLRDEWEFPLVALRELIANALVHRDLDNWSEGSAVEVRLLSDRFVITNPGGLYGITVDRLGQAKQTSARNGALIEICRYVRTDSGARVVETLASGLPRVLESLAECGQPAPLFDDRAIAFSVVLRRGAADAPASLNRTQMRVLAELARGPASVRDLEARLGLKPATIRKALRALPDRIWVDGGKGRPTTYSLRDSD
ncbi:MAG: ATP-dependent helicase RecG [Actinomycetota bacterium]|nr:ATP-dependent helicase RecG [Actinomycetota bacterium]